jgi:anti-anti-sigma regulatory factor
MGVQASSEFYPRQVGTAVVYSCKGYFNDEAGQKLEDMVMKKISEGILAFVVDFSETTLINSVGIAALMTLVFKITDDAQGQIGFAGLDDFKCNVFSVAGLIPLVPVGKTADEAVELIQENS